MESSRPVGSAVTATAETADEIFIDIKAKVKKVIPDSIWYSDLKKIDFELAAGLTRDMKLLQDGVTKPLDVKGVDDHGLSFLQLKVLSGKFLQNLRLPKGSKVVYFRDFYEKLYQVLLNHWSSFECAVVLTGNAGTGKSWFQAYALRRLVQDLRAQDGLAQDGTNIYEFVVRQVENTFFLHDLSTLDVYQIKYEYNDETAFTNVVDGMTKTIYFFEPGPGTDRPPMSFTIPSLSTLSPNQKRIKVYIKQDTVTRLFFPIWSEGEYAAVGLNERLDKADIDDRYYRYGGILQHLFLDGDLLTEELGKRLGTPELKKILLTEVTDVDRVTENGSASGYLVCYTGIPRDGDRAFESRTLRLTSWYVRQKIRENMDLVTEVEAAAMVLKVLSGARMFDFGGKFLESTFTTMIAGGSRKTKWEACKVGTAEWNEHKRNKMTIERIPAVDETGKNTMANSLSKTKHVLAPLNPQFPVVDIVESQPNETEAVTAYQITWQATHPFRMEALCQLREKELKIATSRQLKIYFVVPGKEERYAKKQKTNYLEKKKVLSADETEMWNNTSIYALRPEYVRPEEGWKPAIDKFFFTKGTNGLEEDK